MNASVKFLIVFLIFVGNFFGLIVVSEGWKPLKMEPAKLAFDMSYWKCTSDGCKIVPAFGEELTKPGPWEVENEPTHVRSKRRMFLPDNRLRVREQSVGRFPFNSAVAIRVNGEVKCSGVALLKHRFFLTAAHCVQPDEKWKGKQELKGGKDAKLIHKLNEYCLGKVKYSKGGEKILKFDLLSDTSVG